MSRTDENRSLCVPCCSEMMKTWLGQTNTPTLSSWLLFYYIKHHMTHSGRGQWYFDDDDALVGWWWLVSAQYSIYACMHVLLPVKLNSIHSPSHTNETHLVFISLQILLYSTGGCCCWTRKQKPPPTII